MIRDIRIEPILNGFIVQAGCQRLAYTSVDELIADMRSYLREPEATEKRILKDKGINRKHTMEISQTEARPANQLEERTAICPPLSAGLLDIPAQDTF